jgi:DNA-binding HxlR family transcriptional regulator
VPTWAPFGLTVYFNGHAWLAAQLKARGIEYELRDNAFTNIADFAVANDLAEHLDIQRIHAKLDEFARHYCPVVQTLQHSYQWSIRQAEYSTDLVFKQPKSLAFYTTLLHLLVLCVKPDNIAAFLGHKLHGNYQGEVGSRFNVRWWGRRLKHSLGPVSIKLYDKFGIVLRIETTVNDVTFFSQYREVHHRDGTHEKCQAKMPKTLYSLAPLREVLVAANRRYLAFISEIETPHAGVPLLNQLTQTRTENQHTYKGFNFLADEEAAILRTLLRGEFAISGLTHRAVQQALPDKTPGQVSRLLKRLRVHGLIKKVGKRYKYYLTDLGRQVAAMALRLREIVAIPMLSQPAAA